MTKDYSEQEKIRRESLKKIMEKSYYITVVGADEPQCLIAIWLVYAFHKMDINSIEDLMDQFSVLIPWSHSRQHHHLYIIVMVLIFVIIVQEHIGIR